MCILSKRVIAFILPFEISIFIPILPHQHYNHLFHPGSFSLLTFHFFVSSLPISLAISSCCLLTDCFVHQPLLLLIRSPFSPVFLLLFFLSHFTLSPPSHHGLPPLLPPLFQKQLHFWFLLATVYDWLVLCFSDSNICRRCPENCKRCTTYNVCTECKPGMR